MRFGTFTRRTGDGDVWGVCGVEGRGDVATSVEGGGDPGADVFLGATWLEQATNSSNPTTAVQQSLIVKRQRGTLPDGPAAPLLHTGLFHEGSTKDDQARKPPHWAFSWRSCIPQNPAQPFATVEGPPASGATPPHPAYAAGLAQDQRRAARNRAYEVDILHTHTVSQGLPCLGKTQPA